MTALDLNDGDAVARAVCRVNARDQGVVPMPSVRIESGVYEVLGTSHGVRCHRDSNGWNLTVDGVPGSQASYVVGPFSTKRAALQFCQIESVL